VKNDNWVLFGLDLGGALQTLVLGASQLLFDDSSWLARRFLPEVRVWHQDKWWRWRAGALRSDDQLFRDDEAVAGCTMLAISSERILFRSLHLPVASELFIEDAVSIEVRSISPFPPESLIYGYRIVQRTGKSLEVLIALTTRSSVDQAVVNWREKFSQPHSSAEPGVCGVDEAGRLVEFPGPATAARQAGYVVKLRRVAVVALVATLTLILLVAVPASSSSLRASRLIDHYEDMRFDARRIDRTMSVLSLQRERLGTIVAGLEDRPDYAYWLNHIANTAPDGTYLERMRVKGLKVEVSGYSDNAANYLRLLTEEFGYSEVNARSAFIRDRRTGLERFTIDWVLVPPVGQEI